MKEIDERTIALCQINELGFLTKNKEKLLEMFRGNQLKDVMEVYRMGYIQRYYDEGQIKIAESKVIKVNNN